MPQGERMLWTDVNRTVYIDTFNDGDTMNVATRQGQSWGWGPPIECLPENQNGRRERGKERRIINIDTELAARIEQIALTRSLSFSQTVEELLTIPLGPLSG